MDVAVAYTSVASARCRPTLIGQCEKPQAVGRQQIQIPTLFPYPHLTANEGMTAAQKRSIMSFAKGRSDCEAERDIIARGFVDMLDLLSKEESNTKDYFKARLYDLETDKNLSDEERQTYSSPLFTQMYDVDDKHDRIRRTILMGLYSFWETSLLNICEYGDATERDSPKKRLSVDNNIKHTSKKNCECGCAIYLQEIYKEEQLPEFARLIKDYIRELRNYITHGTANEERKRTISELSKSHPEFGIKAGCNCKCHLSTYKGLEEILTVIKSALNQAEQQTKLDKR